jgi:hypothetical protein
VLGEITKRGDEYLRTLLIQGAKSAVFTAHRRSDRLSRWIVQLRERVGWQKAAVALANKHARILWSMLVNGQSFDPEHVPTKHQCDRWPHCQRQAEATRPSFLETCASEMHHTGQTGSR